MKHGYYHLHFKDEEIESKNVGKLAKIRWLIAKPELYFRSNLYKVSLKLLSPHLHSLLSLRNWLYWRKEIIPEGNSNSQ